MKKYYIIIISIIVVVLVAIGVSKLIDYDKNQRLKRGEDVYDNQVITDFNYSNIVDGLFIGYRDEGIETIVSFKKDSMPNEPQTYAIHFGKPYVNIIFNENINDEILEELLQQIKVESDEDIPMEIHKFSPKNYLITVSDFKDSITYYFGDIAPITIERKGPLEITVADDDETKFFANEENRIYVLLAPEEKGFVTLTLSEKMNPNAQITMENVPIGNWVDEYNYRIDFSKIQKSIDYATFDKFFSVNGNYLKLYFAPLIITAKQDSKWIDYNTGKELTWGGEYQPYYDKILFSPDNQSFIGIIERVDNYAFVLQEKGKEPYIFEHAYTSDDSVMGYPIQWLNNGEVVYDTRIFNVKTKEKRDIYYSDNKTLGTHEFAYDFIAGKFYLYMLYFKGENRFYVDRWIYDDLTDEPIIEKKFSDVPVIQRGNFGSLPIKICEDGIYWTKFENNQMKVVYEGRDGYTEERTGTSLIFANNQGAVIWKKTDTTDDYIWWEIGKEDVTIPYKDNMQPFGDDFVYFNTEEKQYYRFDSEKGSWVKADYPSDAYLPPQEVNQYYKR